MNSINNPLVGGGGGLGSNFPETIYGNLGTSVCAKFKIIDKHGDERGDSTKKRKLSSRKHVAIETEVTR